jgi:hypothetical protein
LSDNSRLYIIMSYRLDVNVRAIRVAMTDKDMRDITTK